jgi:hypothetical protein
MVASVLPASSLNVVVVMPLRDDWSSAAELIRRLDQAIASYPCALHVLLVDDGSAQGCNSADFQSDFAVMQTIQTLRLRRNLGHQRAIAIGLAHIDQTAACDAVLWMQTARTHPTGPCNSSAPSRITAARRRSLPNGAAEWNRFCFGPFIESTKLCIAF